MTIDLRCNNCDHISPVSEMACPECQSHSLYTDSVHNAAPAMLKALRDMVNADTPETIVVAFSKARAVLATIDKGE